MDITDCNYCIMYSLQHKDLANAQLARGLSHQMLNPHPLHLKTLPHQPAARAQVQVRVHPQIAQTHAANAQGTKVKAQDHYQVYYTYRLCWKLYRELPFRPNDANFKESYYCRVFFAILWRCQGNCT